MTDEKPRCSERIYSSWSYRPCGRAGAVDRNGQWFCKQHDPEAIKAKAIARKARWDREEDARRLAYERKMGDLAILSAAVKWHRGLAGEQDLRSAIEARIKLDGIEAAE